MAPHDSRPLAWVLALALALLARAAEDRCFDTNSSACASRGSSLLQTTVRTNGGASTPDAEPSARTRESPHHLYEAAPTERVVLRAEQLSAIGVSSKESKAKAKPNSGGGSGSLQATYLEAHNKYRCMHEVPLMEWSDKIAANAQKWADATGGKMKHSGKASRSGVAGFSYLGENLAWGILGKGAVKAWYSEIKDTNGGKVSGFKMATGHYTQVVWKKSTALGCGEKGKLVVCQYGPGGNSGGYRENVLPPQKAEAGCP